ncbi:HPr kinase/phosphatase C-terminal domain-containing protein [Emcibacter sp. SYSU 3D8]|uniref:HPr kinase/phosphorylase n=1 Tax=Emcibacter sp. SYSU 3D8 TaxID=3133969 RepID=UPI0031FE9255
MSTIHATCVDIDGLGVLLRGPSGSGKSDLALRLIDSGAQLVADDYTVVTLRGDRLIATAPQSIKGMLEVRGVGILPMPVKPRAVIAMVVDLITEGEIERLPDPDATIIDGATVPRIQVAPFEVSAAAKVRLAARKYAPQDTET